MNEEMESQCNEQNRFRRDFEVQKEIIRRYDEVLNTKASKISVKESESNMESYVDFKVQRPESQVRELDLTFKHKMKEVEELQKNLPMMVENLVEECIKLNKQKYGEGGPAIDIFGPD